MNSFEIIIIDDIELRFSLISELVLKENFNTYFNDRMNDAKDILYSIMCEKGQRSMTINIMENDKIIEVTKYTKDEFSSAFNINTVDV
jgi:hypothetical protein